MRNLPLANMDYPHTTNYVVLWKINECPYFGMPRLLVAQISFTQYWWLQLITTSWDEKTNCCCLGWEFLIWHHRLFLPTWVANSREVTERPAVLYTIIHSSNQSSTDKIGTIRGFVCAKKTMAHTIQQQTTVVIRRVKCNKFVLGPLLYKTLKSTAARKPTKKKIRVVDRKLISSDFSEM